MPPKIPGRMPDMPTTETVTETVIDTPKQPLGPEEQAALDAKYSVEKKSPAFVELTPDSGTGNRRVEVHGQKYVLDQAHDDDGFPTKLYIRPYTVGEDGNVTFGEPVEDMTKFRDVMADISPEKVKKDKELAVYLMRQIVYRYNDKEARRLRELFKDSLSDDDQKAMAQDIFSTVDTRALNDGFFASPLLKGTAFYSKLYELEDARLKQAGYSSGLGAFRQL